MSEPKTLEEAYDRVVFEARELFLAKQIDYGPDNISALGLKGVFVRTWDKVNRLKRLVWDNVDAKVADESIDDTFEDILNYSIIAMLLRKGWWGLPVLENEMCKEAKNNG